MSMRLNTAAALLAAAFFPTASPAQTKLLRFPDIAGNRVAFCYAGDLWTAPAEGGIAARLTAHPGLELFPKFSPDGQWLAFTGQYEGDEQVYVMPAEGGEPRQLTYYPARGPSAPRHGYDNQVMGWSPDGSSIVFRSQRDADGVRSEGQLFTVPAKGGLAKALPMPTSGAGDFSPDGKRIAYSPLFRDFRTWKRYQGGWAQDLYVYDLATNDAKPFATSVRTERDPMWIGDAIYFASDRDGTLNLYSYDPKTEAVAKVTNGTLWDVRWPSSDNVSRIVYELNGELRVLDVKTKTHLAIPILVPNDGVAMRPSRYSAEKNVEGFELSPKGERALFVARGDVFTVPIEKGPTRNLTNTSNAHDKEARWSPDGKRIAFLSDRSGEDEIWMVDQAGGKPEQITKGGEGMRYAAEWSAEGTHLAFSDKDGKLFVVALADRKPIEIADDERGMIRDYAWSPKGAYLAFSMADANQSRSIHIWSAVDGKVHRVTDDLFNEESPAWDPEGESLFYVSDRDFAPQISGFEWNFATSRSTGIYALTLKKDGKSPFPPQSDEVTFEEKKAEGSEKAKAGDKKKDEPEGKTETKDDTAKDKPEKKEVPFRIDFEGIGSRVTRAPLEGNNIEGLAVGKGHLVYTAVGAPFYGRDSYTKPALKLYAFKDRKESTLVENATGWAISRDGTKLLVRQGESYNLYEVKPEAKDKDKKTVSTKGLAVDRVPAQEWAQFFDETWRRYRDFFYVKNMHGYDWKAIGERYRALLPHVAHRTDLNYVLGEMVAELNVGHAYIQGGDYETPARPKVGLPGARFELDAASGRFRIARILSGHNQEDTYRAPLTEVGVDARVGDYVLEIDGVELKGDDDPYRLLRHKTDPITLTLNAKPALEGARKTTYRPISNEEPLLYLEWTNATREKVAKLTNGRAGYLHIPDMGAPGIYEFIKWFYPQIRKEGLVVDVRSNGGGNVSQWIIERLDTKLLGTRFGRRSEHPGTYPGTVFHGHKVAILNETSASDGDIFPHMFRKAGLGPLVGKRSWGGVVGITGLGPMIDGGTVFVPISGTNEPDGRWAIEGHGVDPDIVVENDPKSVIAGRDPQLERAVQELVKKMDAEPMKLPKPPADPVKTK
ncbi:MAG TPA: S41 family peptidase [Vicinamibacteria bacterium]|nr:S41 family peptidase [Vicinamibacteria bacterium]